MTPLAAPLPLRTTAVWALFREAQAIPHRYGRTGGALLQYDDTRRVFVWADHPVNSIDEVLVDGLPIGGWEWRNEADSTGRPVAMVRFAEAVDEGVTVIARGSGKRHPRTGALLENPALIAWDILANIAGRAVAESQVSDIAAQASTLGLVCAGSIEQRLSVQATVRTLCASVGAVFSATTRGLLRLWPGASQPAAISTVDEGEVDAQAGSDALITDLTLRYAFEAGEPRRALRLDAPAAIERYGQRAATLDAPWIAEPRVALGVATRLLQQAARPQWRITAPARGALAVGDVVTLAHPVLPVSGDALVLDHSWVPDTGRQTVGLRVAAGAVPSVRLVSQSERAASAPLASAGIVTVGDQRLLTLREEDGRPIVGAQVQLNGGVTRSSDAAGRVSFPVSLMPRGEHSLQVTTADGRTLTTLVVVQ